jgi:hypothetical protein
MYCLTSEIISVKTTRRLCPRLTQANEKFVIQEQWSGYRVPEPGMFHDPARREWSSIVTLEIQFVPPGYSLECFAEYLPWKRGMLFGVYRGGCVVSGLLSTHTTATSHSIYTKCTADLL